jgi:predicted ferric reductase
MEPTAALLTVSQLFASLALVAFCLVFAISARSSLVDRVFGGLDKAYVWHKWLGIAALSAVLVHKMTAAPSDSEDARMLGNLAMFALLILTIVAMAARKMRHETWKLVHKLMAIPYAIGLFHYCSHSTYGAFALQPLSLWLGIVNVVGAVCAIYTLAGYRFLGFTRRVTVASVTPTARDTVELVLEPRTRRPPRIRPGQFVFVKGRIAGTRFPAHPFTVSAVGEGGIALSIKGQGRHTSVLVSKVRAGDVLRLSRGYGRFNPAAGGEHQVWVAGGIGIAPFRACARAGLAAGHQVDLFFAYDDPDTAPHLEEVSAWDSDSFRVHLVDRSRHGLLTATKMEEILSTPPQDIYFCGPPPMLHALRRGLPTTRLGRARLHFDEFSLGRPEPRPRTRQPRRRSRRKVAD